MKEIDPTIIKKLTEQANEIVAGNYNNVNQIFELTDKSKCSTELAELAETFGMMTVKIEAREYALEQKIELVNKQNEEIKELSSIRSLMSTVFVSIILLITVYIFVLGIISEGSSASGFLGKILQRYPVIELVSLGLILYVVMVSKLRLSDFGITRKGLSKSVFESLWITLVIIIILAVGKFVLNRFYPGLFKEEKILDWTYFDIYYITYIVVAPVQEFLARGAVQGILMRLLDLRYKGFISILVTTFIFAAMHVMTSLNLALVSFIMGWIWGWMYLRHKNLAGVSLSHMLVGNISGFMGYWTLF